jgi:LuxR family maltose regulon positive regulatory protein
MVHAIRTTHPSFGEDLLEDLMEGGHFTRSEDLRFFGSRYINELTRIDQPTLLILDDFHLIEQSKAIEEWMLWFIQHLPEQFHLVISSRTRPNWGLLSSLKVKGNVLELTEKDLAFTAEEIEVLFEDYYQYPLEKVQIDQIVLKTEGWVIAIQMIWQQIAADGNLKSFLQSDAESMEDLFGYLALEVLHKQPPNIQLFLEQTCIFDEFTESLCFEALNIEDAQQSIDFLLNRNLFLFSVGDRQYRYHALFKDFLQKELRKKKQQFKALHEQAAHYFRSHYQYPKAMFHLQILEEKHSLAEILQTHGKTMIEQGQLENLLSVLENLGEDIKDSFYPLWILEGEIYRYRCLYETALTCYRRAEKRAIIKSDGAGQSAGLEGQARIYLDTIQPKKVDVLLNKSIEVLEELEYAIPDQRVRLYSLMAENLVNLGQAEKATQWVEKSRSLSSDFHMEELEARLLLRTGKLQQTKKLLEKHKREEMEKWNKRLPKSHRETDLLLSLVTSFLGEPEKSKRYAEEGMMKGIKSKAPFVEACGWIRMGHAVQLFDKYDQDLAVQCYQTALTMMESIEVSRGKAEPLMGLCLLYGREGKFNLALQYGEQALQETEKVEDMWLSSFIRLCLGISYIYSSKWVESSRYLEQSYRSFAKCGDSYGKTLVCLWQTLSAYQLEQSDLFKTKVDEWLDLMKKGEYDFLVQRRTAFGPRDVQRFVPILLEAQKYRIQENYVSRLLVELGLEKATSHPGYTLRVKTLGEFRIWLGEKEVNEKDWQREKAKELFQLLITKRENLIPKDQIYSLLWKDAEEHVATRDFKVAHNALNKVLEPNREVRSAPYFIQRYESTYGLHTASAFELDSAEFERFIQAGLDERNQEEARILLQKGLEIYTGDYLPERRHEDWCLDERERLQVLYLRGAERYAQLSVAVEGYDLAIYWCEQILAKDSCWEEAYRLLMFCYYRKNNRPQALKWYQKCCEKLEQEVGVAPMPSTEEMYSIVMNKKF